MAQTQQLIDTLKKALKSHGHTYADVATHLALSEASVKRLFSEKNFSLKRLEEVCQLMDMEISHLVQMMNERADATAISALSFEQEQEIASDLELLLVTVCVLNHWTVEEIIEYYQLSETQCIKHLAKLDRLKMIELLPKNRVKRLVAKNFKWRDNGPIQRFFLDKIEAEFFTTHFQGECERLIVMNGMLSESSNAVFQRKMEQLGRMFDELNDEDARLPLDKRSGTTLVLAIRPWNYGLFEPFRRQP